MFTSKSIGRNLSARPNYDSNYSLSIAGRRYRNSISAGGNTRCSTARELLGLGVLFTWVSVFAGQIAEAVPCATGEFLGTTTYVTKTYTPISATLWREGFISWSRDVTWSCNQNTRLVEACYASEWARFWAWKATMTRKTDTKVPLPNFIRGDTRWFCGGTPPSEDLPDEEADLEVVEGIRNDGPGSMAHALALVARTIGHPGEGVPDAATFEDILVDYGVKFTLVAATFDQLFASGLSVQIPEEVRLDEVIDEMGDAVFDVGVELGTGAPTDPSAFRSVSNLLDEIVAHPSMATDPLYKAVFPNLVSASQAMNNLGDIVIVGFTDDAVRLNFLTSIEEFRQEFLNFALRFAEVDGRISDIPTVSEWGLVVMTLLLLAVGTILIARRRARTA